MKNNKLMPAASVFSMAASAMLISLAVALSADLIGAVGLGITCIYNDVTRSKSNE